MTILLVGSQQSAVGKHEYFKDNIRAPVFELLRPVVFCKSNLVNCQLSTAS